MLLSRLPCRIPQLPAGTPTAEAATGGNDSWRKKKDKDGKRKIEKRKEKEEEKEEKKELEEFEEEEEEV